MIKCDEVRKEASHIEKVIMRYIRHFDGDVDVGYMVDVDRRPVMMSEQTFVESVVAIVDRELERCSCGRPMYADGRRVLPPKSTWCAGCCHCASVKECGTCQRNFRMDRITGSEDDSFCQAHEVR